MKKLATTSDYEVIRSFTLDNPRTPHFTFMNKLTGKLIYKGDPKYEELENILMAFRERYGIYE